MGFDPGKDVELNRWKFEDENNNLIITLNSYNNGPSKVQIGPREYTKKDGSIGYRKCGRISLKEMQWIGEVIKEMNIENLLSE